MYYNNIVIKTLQNKAYNYKSTGFRYLKKWF